MGKVYWALASGLLLMSCREEAPEPLPSESAAATPVPPETPAIVSGARDVREETDDFLFEYSYPVEAGRIPALAAMLDARLERERTSLARQSAEAREDAGDDGFPFNKYSTGVEWQVVADTPRFLSLSASLSSYSGGAHGNYGFDSLVWDREADAALEPVAMFTSLAALEEVLGEDLCDMLNVERATRRGEPIEPGSDDMFDQCVPLSDTTILLGSTNGRAFNRIGVQMGPYVAGPYAESAYEFTLPVTRAVMDTVKEDYRSAFAPRN
ncbi:DUF4163 domain-containing protein [Alteraurantiacibacter aquimixticola]|nr:DUF4163 domain-containing protein [Alteraurantiacibacter aquimixticola]